MQWKLAEAKNKFSEVVERALTEGPQRVTRRDEAVIVVSEREYDDLAGRTFKELLMSGPDLTGLDLTRDKSAGRKVRL